MVVRGVFAAAALLLVAAVATVSGTLGGVAVAAPSDVGPAIPGAHVVTPAAPAPDPVPATCAWLVKGYFSNCDGLDPNELYTSTAWPTACLANNDLLMRTVSAATLPDGSRIQLTYSGGTGSGCRTVAASFYAPHYTGSAVCSVTLTRSSDGATSTSEVARVGGFWSAETLSFYDAGVASSAAATCTYGGHTYTGHTASY
jgi:hypothetical protein